MVDGRGRTGAIRIGPRDATLWGLLTPHDGPFVLSGRHVHLFVAFGEICLTGTGRMNGGGGARITSAANLAADAGPSGGESSVGS